MSAWAQTRTGRVLDYDAPVIAAEHLFSEVAHGLSLISRFGGSTETAYSVAQHSVIMAEAAEDETGDAELAAFCLLHDGHETPFGDIPSPSKAAIADEIEAALRRRGASEAVSGAMREVFKEAVRAVTNRFDAAIFAAAGLSHERYRARAAEVHAYDMRALLTERRDLLLPPPRRWVVDDQGFKFLPMRLGRIRCWTSGLAEERFVETLTRLCPEAARAAGRQTEPA